MNLEKSDFESASKQLRVAIPTYQGGRYIEEVLRSLIGQVGVGPIDTILSDEGSTDGTVERARRLAGDRLSVVVNQERLGLAGNWNQCVRLARTPFVAIVHQDDVLMPDHLAVHLAMLSAHRELGMTVSGAEAMDAEGRPIPGQSIERGWIADEDRLYARGEFVSELAVRNPVRCSAVVLRREAFEDVGGFSADWGYVVDWEFWLRLSERWGVGWIARTTVQARWHGESETRRFHRGLRDLEEQERLLGRLWSDRREWLRSRGVEEFEWRKRLGQAYLNRAQMSLRGGRPALARRAWRRARRLWPGVIGEVAQDPRLLVQIGMLSSCPRTAARWLRRAE